MRLNPTGTSRGHRWPYSPKCFYNVNCGVKLKLAFKNKVNLLKLTNLKRKSIMFRCKVTHLFLYGQSEAKAKQGTDQGIVKIISSSTLNVVIKTFL